jgi:hypothetical protein
MYLALRYQMADARDAHVETVETVELLVQKNNLFPKVQCVSWA